jgi:sialic acid synthase SpsE
MPAPPIRAVSALPGNSSGGAGEPRRAFAIGGVEYRRGCALVVAELGTSHGADAVKAGELIAAAAEAGADCVKFQWVYADEILHPGTGEVELPGGSAPLYERFRALERPPEFYAGLKEAAEKRGLLFLCTPFGPRSARELLALRPACVKIASPELNYTGLLACVRRAGLPVLLSTGVSRLGDVEAALDTLGGEEEAAPPVCLLHCVTSYPAPETDYNLRAMRNLGGVFGVPVGVSDHSLDSCLVPALAAALGACVIEKHFCLSRSGSGLDDPIALPPEDFARMVRAVRRAEGQGEEEAVAECREAHGAALVEAVLGSGVKRLAPAERAAYGRTNRSVHALRDIEAGEVFTAAMVAPLRTEKRLRPGLPPSFEERILGRPARRFIPSGEGVRFEDVF